MRTIRSISNTREMIYSAYNREPVLACAAGSLSMTYEQSHPIHLIDTLRMLVLTGLVSVGDQGEQILAYLYIIARDILANDQDSRSQSHPLIKVSALLDQIHYRSCQVLRTDVEKDTHRLHNLEMLLDGEVSFCQFIDIEATPNLKMIKEGFYGGTAFISRPNQAGVDILIPVRISKSKSFKSFVLDKSVPAERGIFRNSHDILLAASTLLPDPNANLSKIPEPILSKLKLALKYSLVDIITNHDDFWYSAICIQSKNTDRDDPADNKGVDLKFSYTLHIYKTCPETEYAK
jgi:hypothetical protein